VIATRYVLGGALLALSVVAAACGGGSGSVTPSVTKTVSKTPQAVKISVVVPAASRTATAAIKRRMQTAEGTAGIAFVVYPNPQASNPPLQTDAFDISSTSADCTVNTDLSRTCTLSIPLTAGVYDIDATTYDSAPVSGTIPGGAHALGSAALIGTTISASVANSLSFSIDGIAASTAVTLPISQVRGLDAVTQQAAVSVLDADNNVILSNSYVDALGNPVSVSLSDSASTGLVTISPSSFSAPLATGASVAYSPANITVAQMTSGTQALVTASLSSGPSASSALNVAAPLLSASIPIPARHGITASGGVAYVPYSLSSTAPEVAAISQSSMTVSTIPVASSGGTPEPYDVAVGPDGNLWMSDLNNGDLLYSNTGGTSSGIVPVAGPSGVGTSITSSGSGLLWAISTTGNQLWQSTTSFISLNLPLSGTSPQAITDSGGQLWITDAGGTAEIEERNDVTGLLTNIFPIPAPSSPPGPLGIVQGPDGNIWFAETNADMITSLSGGTFSQHTITKSPLYIANGPDGNVWFDYSSPSAGIGRMNTSGGNIQYFPLPAGVVPGEMIASNGVIWIVDTEGTNPRVFQLRT
jgi:virginiamycin B lyase